MSLRLSSSAASSSSSRTSALACSATLLVALPTPCWCSVPGVGMASPVDHLCDEDPGRQVLQALGAALDEEVGFRHRVVGGSSPVASRQTFEAVLRATTVAPAAIPP